MASTKTTASTPLPELVRRIQATEHAIADATAAMNEDETKLYSLEESLEGRKAELRELRQSLEQLQQRYQIEADEAALAETEKRGRELAIAINKRGRELEKMVADLRALGVVKQTDRQDDIPLCLYSPGVGTVRMTTRRIASANNLGQRYPEAAKDAGLA